FDRERMEAVLDRQRANGGRIVQPVDVDPADLDPRFTATLDELLEVLVRDVPRFDAILRVVDAGDGNPDLGDGHPLNLGEVDPRSGARLAPLETGRKLQAFAVELVLVDGGETHG